MPAILTDQLRRQVLNDLLDDIKTGTEGYYIAIGRSDIWGEEDITPIPTQSAQQVIDAQSSFQSMIKVSSESMVIPRYNWSANTLYSGYDNNAEGYPSNSYYVLTADQNVYICIRPAITADGVKVVSTVQPTGTSLNPFQTGDGYVWKFCYEVGAANASDFLAANFIPVAYIDSADGNDIQSVQDQAAIHAAAVPGQINQIILQDGGTGYSSTPTITIKGDGINASATATVVNGSIKKIEIDDSAGGGFGIGGNMGSGYTRASVSITGGGVDDLADNAAKATASISPRNGFGYDPTEDLKAAALMYTAKPDGIEEGAGGEDTFIIGNDFRQVSLVKGPQTTGGSPVPYTARTGMCLQKMTFASPPSPIFSLDGIIEGDTSGARAIIDRLDTSELYFHQNEVTGYGTFIANEAITEISSGNGSGTTDSVPVEDTDIDPYSGEVIFIDNRAGIMRSVEQTEDIKIIVKV
jgi:hypothetical protein